MGKAPWVEDYDAVVRTSVALILAVEGKEVFAVVGDDRPPVLLGVVEQVGVGEAT